MNWTKSAMHELGSIYSLTQAQTTEQVTWVQSLAKSVKTRLHLAAFCEQKRSLFHHDDHLICRIFYIRDDYSKCSFDIQVSAI